VSISELLTNPGRLPIRKCTVFHKGRDINRLRGNAFGEKAQTIPQTRHFAGLAVVVIDADLTENGTLGETNLMADRLQAATAFYKFVQYSKKLLQKCII
jgi:hypothetical protein